MGPPQLDVCERDLSAEGFGSKAQLPADIGQGDQPVIMARRRCPQEPASRTR